MKETIRYIRYIYVYKVHICVNFEVDGGQD